MSLVLVAKFDTQHLKSFDFSRLGPQFLGAHLGAEVMGRVALAGASYSVILDGQVVFVGGLAPVWTGVAEAWSLMLPEATRCFKPIHRATKELFAMFFAKGGWRIQTTVLAGFLPGWDWVRHLGFLSEGPMEKYGPDGQDYYRFKIVKGGRDGQ